MRKGPSAHDLQAAIRAKCLDCTCGSRKEVERCKTDACPLHAYREGPTRERVKPVRGHITMFELIRREA